MILLWSVVLGGELLLIAGLVWVCLKLNAINASVKTLSVSSWKADLQQVKTQLSSLNHQLSQTDDGLKGFPWVLTSTWKGPLLKFILKEGGKKLRNHFL
jgi:hypothetical protein